MPQDPQKKANPLDALFPVQPVQAVQNNPLPPTPGPVGNPLESLFPSDGLSTVQGRMKKEADDIQNTIIRLKSIVPKNAGHKARIDRLVDSLMLQLENKHPGRSGLEEFTRGAAAGAASGLQFPVELLGDALALTGNKDLQDYIETNKQLIAEDSGVGTGAAATAGEIFGGIVGSAPAAGGLAEATGRAVVGLAPSSRIAAAIAAGQAGGLGARVATNVITGLPINALTSFGGAEQDIPEGASPEEAQRIREMNTANKLKQLAIGIGADALFGALPVGKKAKAEAQAHLGMAEKAADDITSGAPLTPERQAQLDRVKAQNAVKVAVKRKEALMKSLAQSEWQIQNPDLLWKELKPDAKRKIYDDFKTRQSNSDSNTLPGMMTPEQQMQVVSLDENLTKLQGERDEAMRLAETDHLLGIGNGRALEKARVKADADPNTRIIWVDVNGLKGFNDGLGEAAGDQLLKDLRDGIIAAHTSEGLVTAGGTPSTRIFRVRDGGDEFAILAPADRADALLARIRRDVVVRNGGQVGSVSGAVFDNLDQALSLEGKAKIKSAQYEDKARLGIPGRNAEEQRLIDAIKLRQDTEPPPVAPTVPVGQKGTKIAAAAVKVGDKVVTGTSHFDIAQKLSNAELDAKPIDGWVDDKGNFLSREEGMALAREAGQVDPKAAGEDPSLGYEYLNKETRDKLLDLSVSRNPIKEETKPFPPEVMQAIAEVSRAGGLTNPEQHRAFVEELTRIYGQKELTPEQLGREIQSLIEDFTPFSLDDLETSRNLLHEGVITKEDYRGDLSAAISTDEAQAERARVEDWLKHKIPFHPSRVENFPDLNAKYGDEVRARWAEAEGMTPEEFQRAIHEPYQKAAVDELVGSHTAEDPTLPSEEMQAILEKQHTEQQAHRDAGGPADLAKVRRAMMSPEELAAQAERALVANEAAKAEAVHLESIEHKKPLSEMSEKELSKVDDKLTDALDEVKKGSPEEAVLQRDFEAVRNEYARRNKEAKGSAPVEAQPLPEGLNVRPEYNPDAIQRTTGHSVPKDINTGTLIDEALLRLRKLSPRKMTDGEIEVHLRDLETQRRDATTAPEQEEVQKKINKVLAEKTFRQKAIYGKVPPIIGPATEGLAGFAYGFSGVGSQDPQEDQSISDRITNGLMWAGVVATGVLATRMLARAGHVPKPGERVPVPSDKWLGSDVADRKIINQEDIEKRSKDWRARARDWYTGIARRSYGMDVATSQMGGSKLAASKNPAKLIAMFGRWVSQSEGALMDRPTYTDLAGNVVQLPALSYREIVAMVNNDLRGLGKLMAARTSIEGAGLRTVPFDPVTADLIFRSAPEHYHKAADAMRQFDLAMSQVLESAGVLAPGTGEKFASEEFYAALRRVFDPDSGPSRVVKDASGKIIIGSPNPVKGRTGGHGRQVFNPAETTAAMVPQIYRAAELNNIKNRFVDLWEAAGRPNHILKQAERRKLPISVDQQLRVAALRQEVKGLGQAEAESIVAAFDPKSLDPRSNVMTVYRDGVLRSYKVDESVASAMASLHPDELEGLWKVLGMPAGIARKGVVLNPFFVAKQSFIDNWQATLNSQYGFRWGVDQFIGWTNIMRHTPEYQKFLAAGGGHSTLQSHEFANVRTALQAVRHGGGSPFNVAVKQLREFKLIDAYKTLIVPFSEAARVGEYLRARGHGASVLDGVYAAKHVTANFQQRGAFNVVRGLDRASLFLNPAIQGLDQALFRSGLNPFRAPEEGRKEAAAKYLAKAFISITLPSMYLWMANKDDQEITDLRKTDSGQKYWFVRSPVDAPKLGMKKGDIVKIPKPIVDGQIFGSSMEATLDKMYQDDPESVHRAVSAMGRDVGFNILPTMGVLYYGLQTNTNIGLGGNIVPQGDENLAIEHRGEDRASWLARTVSKGAAKIVPDNAPDILKNAITPAGLDYINSSVGGMLGQDAMIALTQAMDAEQKGYVPAKEELPLVTRIFAGYPSTNVEPLRTFYERAEKTQEVGATINHLATEDPSRLATYMASNKRDYVLVGMFAKTRQDIANYRRAIQDIKDMPGGTVSSEDRRDYIKKYMTLMIETARQANLFAREVDRAYEGR